MIDNETDARLYCAQIAGPDALLCLEQLATMLAAENQHQNLVSAKSLTELWRRHFADSLQMIEFMPDSEGRLLDLGSGAGLPGLVLAIARPELEVVLVEARKRRVEWLRTAIEQLKLQHCEVYASRLEDVASFPAGIITARAFAPLAKLLRLSARFSTPSTLWLLPKGRSAAQELVDQPSPVRNMFHVKHSRTDPAGGILVGKGVPQFQ